MKRLRGLIFFVVGLVLIVLGFGMWQSPEINWESFLKTWFLIINDIARLIDDPFGVLGVVVLVVGVFVAVNGLQRLVRG